MLRISTEPEGATQTQDPAASAVSSGSPVPPTVDLASSPGISPRENPVAGKNHAAMLIPWISNEMRFHSVLDMASGDGQAVALLGEHGYDAWGVDLAPTGGPAATIIEGDLFSVPVEDGYFDLVLCANTAQEIEDHRIASLLAEMNRLSNSYLLISCPGPEAAAGTPGRIRDVSWWCQRIADFDWRVRLLREEPETGQLVLLAEKADSLAAKVLPLLDQGAEPQPAPTSESTSPAPTTPELSSETVEALENARTLLTSALENFAAGRIDAGYLAISDMAHALAPAGGSVPGLFEALGQLVDAMEERDEEGTIQHLAHGILPLLQQSLAR